jgi:glycosyltransferase involved in cell wall biosynthesis
MVRTRHISAPIPQNFLTRWLYRRATARVVTTGERLREQVIRETGLEPVRVCSVPTGVDLERFIPGDRAAARARLGLAPQAFIVGIVATLRSWKGHAYLIAAMAQVPQAHLVIVGDGPGREKIAAQVGDLGLRSRVTLAGHQEDVVAWMQSCDLLALPSYANEGVPQALMQGMACALPIVTTSVGAIGEIAVHETNALVVPERDAEALASAIRRLRDEPGLRDRLGAAGRARAQTQFSMERMLDRMEELFCSLLQAGSASSRPA